MTARPKLLVCAPKPEVCPSCAFVYGARHVEAPCPHRRPAKDRERVLLEGGPLYTPGAGGECPGAGKCHGCLKWCDECGDVAHVCDTRLRGDRCDEHPVPPDSLILRTTRRGAEKMIRDARQMLADGARDIEEVTEGEIARREYDRQMTEDGLRLFEVPR